MAQDKEVRWQLNNGFTPLRNKMADPQSDAEMLNSQTANDMHAHLAGQESTIHNGNGGGDDNDPPVSGMDDDEFLAACRAQYVSAKEYLEGYIIPYQAAAIRAFNGIGPEITEEGRSQVTLTDVRDTVLMAEEPILEILTGSDTVVELMPTSQEKVDDAKQATDYLNYVFMVDNNGYELIQAYVRDSGVCGMGIGKLRWSEDKEITEERYTGLTSDQIATYLQNDKSLSILELNEEQEITGPDGQPLITYRCKIRREISHDGLIIEALPPEEFMVSREAKNIAKSPFTAHVRQMYVSEIVAMGYPKEVVEEYRGDGSAVSMQSMERIARNPANYYQSTLSTPDESMQKVQFIEAFVLVDRDKDGIAELHLVHALGDMQHILHSEIAPRIPFATFCHLPQPHTVYGQSIAQQVMVIQDIKTNLFRNGLDEYGLTVHPQRAYLKGAVNVDDLMQNDPGSLVEVTQPGAIQELTRQFDANSLVAMLNYTDQAKAKMTGMSDASQGLDPTVLQDVVKAGVMSTVNSAQSRQVLYTRNLAEGLKRLFKLAAEMLREHQDIPRTVQLNGTWVTVDPRTWIGDLTVTTNVALGKGTAQDKMMFLNGVAQRQEAYIQNPQGGPFNPVAPLDKLSNTLAQLVNLGGFKNNTKYFNEITPQQVQAMQAAQAKQPPPPNPQMLEAQAAAQQAKASSDLAMMKFQWEQYKDAAKEQFDREKELLDAGVQIITTAMAHGVKADMAAWEQLVSHTNNQATQQVETLKALLDNHAQMNPPPPIPPQNPGEPPPTQ